MEIVQAPSDIEYARLAALIEAEWPRQWKAASLPEMVAEIESSADRRYDVNKLLVDEGRIVGWYRYSRWPRDEANTTEAHTLDIAVAPELQGRGLGTRLMLDLIADCRARGYRGLMSRTFPDNEASIALHRKTGFSEAFRTEDSIVWKISLAPTE